MDILEADPVHIDELSKRLPLGSGRLAGLLLQLELKGVVVQSPGKLFGLSPGIDPKQLKSLDNNCEAQTN